MSDHRDAILPLTNVRVLDLGTRIGAPFAATLLGDFGADIIKVELPGAGDFMRSIGPFVDGYSLFWAVEAAASDPSRSICASPRGGRCCCSSSSAPTSSSRTSDPARSRSGGSATRRWPP